MRKKLLTLVLTSLLFPSLVYSNDGDMVVKNEDETKHFVIGDLEWSPSSDVYTNWDNYSVHTYVQNVPDHFEIDLTDFEVPIKSNQVNSPFGKRIARMHQGVDIKANFTDTIYAAFDGKVRVSRYDVGGYGNFVVIRHYNGLETVYGHMSRNMVVPNQYVIAGQPIGLAGSTGRSSGVHLHFEMRFCGIALDPQKLISFEYGFPLVDTYRFNKSGKTTHIAKNNKKRR